jgi:hypothetical protein
MGLPNGDNNPTDNKEALKQQAAGCSSGCDCHSQKASGKKRMIIGALVLVAAGTLVVRAMTKSNEVSQKSPTATFSAPTAPQPATVKTGESTPSASPPSKTTKEAEPIIGTAIGTFSELNFLAAQTDAILIFVPGKEGTSGNLPSTPMKDAARTIEAKGLKCGLFTLKAGSPDYDKIAGQMSTPGVLAMVKGGGMSAVSGDVTEMKLVQAFLVASSGGGCGSATGGCGPSGCK